MDTKVAFDYDYADPDKSDHLYEIFRVSDGKRVAWADTKDEAQETISKLERE